MRRGVSASKLLRPLGAPRSLSAEVVDRLAEQIMSGKLPAGAKLPSEQEMMRGMGVSRTVVREAVAALRARGLVITRQGAGAFVDRAASRQPYVIDPDGLGSLDSVLDILELRMAVESEAAAIASERATGDPDQGDQGGATRLQPRHFRWRTCDQGGLRLPSGHRRWRPKIAASSSFSIFSAA